VFSVANKTGQLFWTEILDYLILGTCVPAYDTVPEFDPIL
jgi:hypothetical protein